MPEAREIPPKIAASPDWFRLVLSLVFALYFGRCLLKPHDYLFIYNVDFVFHEAGHLFFSWGGKFLTDLGGTLMQLLLPSIAFFQLFRQGKWHSASLILFWIGENWINISIYARDARARLLPLHGGDAVTHDWSEILMAVNLLHHDIAVGNFFYGLGFLSMAAALAAGVYFSFNPIDRESSSAL